MQEFFGRLKSSIDQISAWGESTAQGVNKQTGGFAGMLYRAIDDFGKHGPREAAALSYYALFSLFPLLLLIVAIIGQFLGPAATGNELEDFLRLFLPGSVAEEVNRSIARFVSQGNSAGIIAFISLSWSSLALFSNLESALSRTFRAPSRSLWHRRGIGLLMVLTLGVLLVANVMTSLLFSFLEVIFIARNSIWLAIAGIFIPFGFSMGIFAMMYRLVPRRQVRWDAIWPAALIGAAAWESAKVIFGWWLDSLSNLSLVYGSITTVIIFMLWAFYTFAIILLCGEFCVGLADWQEARRERRDTGDDFAHDFYDKLMAG